MSERSDFLRSRLFPDSNQPIAEEDPIVEEPLQPELTHTDGLNLGMQKNPDAYSKVVDIADKAGLHPDLVEGKEAEIDRDTQFKVNDQKLREKSQFLKDRFADPTFAGQAHDDIDVLDKLNEVVNNVGDVSYYAADSLFGEDQTFDSLGSVIYNESLNQFDNLLLSNLEAAEDSYKGGLLSRVATPSQFMPPDVRQERIVDISERVYQRNLENQEATPEGLNVVQEGARAGIQSVAQMGIAGAIALVTKTGTPGILGSMGLQTFGSSYGQGRDGGLTPKEAGLYATVQAAIEVGTEVLPVKSLEGIFSTAIRSDIGKRVVNFMLKEMGTEQIATLLQSAVDIGVGIDEEINNATSLEEKISLQARRQVVTAFAVLVGGGTQAGIATAASRAIGSLKDETDLDAIKAEKEQSEIDQIIETAESSKLKDRSPEAFKQYVNDAAPDKKVFIDAAQAKLYLQEVGEEAVKADPILQTIADQVNQAEAINGSVELTMGEFAADMVGSEHIEALRPLMTLNENTVAPFRQEAEAEQRQHMMKSIIAEAEKSGDLYDEAREIYETHQAELIKTGRIDKRAAKHLAEFLPAYATVVANDPANVGLSLIEVYNKMGLKVEGPFEERKEQVEQGRAELNREQDFNGVTFTQDRVTPTGENVTITRNVQREWDQTSKRRDVVNKLIGCLGG